MKPMLAESIEMNQIDRYLKDPTWAANQKLDGDRLLICITDGDIAVLNREGEPRRNAVPRTLLDQFQPWPGTWCFDGELLDGELWLFDLPTAGHGHVTPEHGYLFRMDVLERIYRTWKPHGIRLLPVARTTEAKRQLLRYVERNDGEGVMFKRVNGIYRPGRRSRDMLKAKFTKTCEAIVTAVGVDGHNNCHYSVFDGEQLVEIGSCSLNGKPAVAIGDVIELRYLYASDDRRLYQPRLLRVRHDKAPRSCSIDQLAYTDRTVLMPGKQLPNLAGLRQQRRSKATGTLVSIYNAREQGLDDEGGRWVTVCEDHASICNHDTLKLARHFAPFPNNWCEDCRELLGETSET